MADLATANRSSLGIKPFAGPGVRLSERTLGSLVQVAVWSEQSAMDAALAREKIPSMPDPLGSATGGDTTIMNVGPARALIAAARTDLFAALSASVPADEGTVTDRTHARVCLRLEGERARWVLMKGVAIDLHPTAFPVRRTVVTEVAHIGIVLRRASETAYDLYPNRGYALALIDWLGKAGAPDGRNAG